MGLIGNTAAGVGMGVLLGDYNDERQINQERRLQGLEIAGQQKMAQFNYDQQMKMWNETNYSAQIAQMKKAGLNPGLMYGMGGSGGATTQAAQAQGPKTGGAPKGGGEALAMGGMGMQLAMTQAQTELLKAQAVTEGTKPANVEAGTKNIEANTALTGVQTDIARVEKEIAGRTKEDAIDTITYEASYTIAKALREGRQNNIEAGTMDTKLKTIKAEYIALALENILTGAKTANVNADTKLKGAQTKTEGERRFLTREQARQIGQNIMLGWDGLTTEQRRLRIQEQMRDYSQNEGQVLDLAEQAVDGIMRNPGSPKGKQKWESGENGDGTRWSRESYEKYDK